MDELSERIGEAVLAMLPAGHPDPELARFQALMRDYPRRGGKRLRGVLVMLSTEAHGGEGEGALRVAAALELFQNWVLVHDDIEDDSEERRGLPALHRTVGLPVALNVGDAMHVHMWASLLELRSSQGFDADAIRREFLWMIGRTAEGQHLDLAWVAQGRFALSEADYLAMVRLKTAAYTVTSPLRLGAFASGAAPDEAFAAIGDDLGAAFQIRDDVLNLTARAESGRYGKEFAGDLLEGKRTLVLTHLLGTATRADADETIRRLGAPRASRSDDDVAWILGRMRHYGSLRYAQDVAERLATAGLGELRGVLGRLPGRRAAARIEELLQTLARRTH